MNLMYYVLFNLFSPLLAEKALIFICLALLAYSSIALLSQSSEGSYFIYFMLVPLLFSFQLGLGFYNYLFSLGFFFLSIVFAEKLSLGFTCQRWLMLLLIFSLLYLSHGFNFLLSVLVCLFIVNFNYVEMNSIFNVETVLIKWIKKSYAIILAAGPGLVLMFLFLRGRTNFNSENLTFGEKLSFIQELRPLLVYSDIERVCSKVYFFIYFGLFCIALYKFFRNISEGGSQRPIGNAKWLIIFVFIILLYFLLPDQMAGGGYVSIRLLYLSFFFGLYFIHSIGFSNTTYKYFCLTLLIPFLFSFNEKLKVHRSLSATVKLLEEAQNKLEPNSILLPVYHGDNWLEGHISNLLGINKKIIILENYEANTGYFPVSWKEDQAIAIYAPAELSNEHNQIGISLVNDPVIDSLDYIAFIGYTKSNENIFKLLEKCKEGHELLIENPFCKIFKIRY